MLTWCPWVWTSGAKHPNRGGRWQLGCEARSKAGGGRSPAPSLHSGARLELITQRLGQRPRLSLGQQDTSHTLQPSQGALASRHLPLTKLQKCFILSTNGVIVSCFWVPFPQHVTRHPLKTVPFFLSSQHLDCSWGRRNEKPQAAPASHLDGRCLDLSGLFWGGTPQRDSYRWLHLSSQPWPSSHSPGKTQLALRGDRESVCTR